MNKTGISFLVALLLQLFLAITPARAAAPAPTPESAGLRVESLGKGVYAVIGSTSGRTYDNLGMNANLALLKNSGQ